MPTTPAGRVSRELATEIRVLLTELRRTLREPSSLGEFTPSQSAVLIRLDRHGSATVTELAAAEGVRTQSMSATIAPLLETGVLESAPHPTDRRQSILSLTPAMVERVSAKRAAKDEARERVIDETLSDDEQRRLLDGIALLRRVLVP